MVIGTDELERLADDAWKERRIGGTVYCGNCGYNLRTLPYVYQCPECGREYNARPLVMRGIFLPQNVSIPVIDTFAVILFAPIAFALIDGATQPFEPTGFVMGILSAVLTIVYLWIAWGRWARLFKARLIARRIIQSEGE